MINDFFPVSGRFYLLRISAPCYRKSTEHLQLILWLLSCLERRLSVTDITLCL